MKKPAHRGATAGLSDAFRAESFEIVRTEPRVLQAQKLASRFGISLLHASVVAEQAFGTSDTWRSR